jgi:hypothetical protein
MRVQMRPALALAVPRAPATSAGRDRLLRRSATAATVAAAAIAVLVVAVASVVMGIT